MNIFHLRPVHSSCNPSDVSGHEILYVTVHNYMEMNENRSNTTYHISLMRLRGPSQPGLSLVFIHTQWQPNTNVIR